MRRVQGAKGALLRLGFLPMRPATTAQDNKKNDRADDRDE